MSNKNIEKYNRLVLKRINEFFRYFKNKKQRKMLKNKDFTILCNNCTGGIISHDFGIRFNSPTINLFFYGHDFFSFLENLDYYLDKDLEICNSPKYRNEGDLVYPIMNLGDLELHFLHYKSYEDACKAWNRRKKRINKENLYVIWTFFGGTDQKLLSRFEKLNYENKIAFTEKDYHTPNSFYIKGFEKEGLGVITLYDGIFGHRIVDQFDFVKWFNSGSSQNY